MNKRLKDYRNLYSLIKWKDFFLARKLTAPSPQVKFLIILLYIFFLKSKKKISYDLYFYSWCSLRILYYCIIFCNLEYKTCMYICECVDPVAWGWQRYLLCKCNTKLVISSLTYHHLRCTDWLPHREYHILCELCQANLEQFSFCKGKEY